MKPAILALALCLSALCPCLAGELPADAQNPYLTILVTDQAATPAEAAAVRLCEEFGDRLRELREKLHLRTVRQSDPTYQQTLKKTMPKPPAAVAQKADGTPLWVETEAAALPQTEAAWTRAAEQVVQKAQNCAGGRCRPRPEPQPIKVDVPDTVKIDVPALNRVPLDPRPDVPTWVYATAAFLAALAVGVAVSFVARVRRAV